MLKRYLFPVLVFFLVLAACAPAARKVPAAEPIFYDGSLDKVYAAVVQAISTSPGLDNSDGWVIMQSDAAGGFVSAGTTVEEPGFFGSTDVPESVSVIVSDNGDGRTQVVIQLSAGAEALAERIRTQLDQKFLRL